MILSPLEMIRRFKIQTTRSQAAVTLRLKKKVATRFQAVTLHLKKKVTTRSQVDEVLHLKTIPRSQTTLNHRLETTIRLTLKFPNCRLLMVIEPSKTIYQNVSAQKTLSILRLRTS